MDTPIAANEVLAVAFNLVEETGLLVVYDTTTSSVLATISSRLAERPASFSVDLDSLSRGQSPAWPSFGASPRVEVKPSAAPGKGVAMLIGIGGGMLLSMRRHRKVASHPRGFHVANHDLPRINTPATTP